MNKEQFVKLLGAEAQSMTPQEIDTCYDQCVNLFNVLFNKFKREKIESMRLK